MEVGLQTYTIRNLMKKPSALPAAFSAVKDAGYSFAELAVDYLGFDLNERTASQIAEAAAKNGVRIVSCQIKDAVLRADPARIAKCVHMLGADHVSLSVIDVPLMLKGRAGVLACCEKENRLFDELAENGIRLSHHNHHFEFLKAEPQSSETVFDVLASNLKGGFAFDTYWAARGGVNHLLVLENLRGRVEVMHLRDFRLHFSFRGPSPSDAAVGEGNLPFGAILQKAAECGVKYGFVEQNTKQYLEKIKVSQKNLNQIRGL